MPATSVASLLLLVTAAVAGWLFLSLTSTPGLAGPERLMSALGAVLLLTGLVVIGLTLAALVVA